MIKFFAFLLFAAVLLLTADHFYPYVRAWQTTPADCRFEEVAVNDVPEEADRLYREAALYDPKIRVEDYAPKKAWLDDGGKEDTRKTRELTRQAAELGHTRAMFNLGNMLLKGRGGPVNNMGAFDWYRKAAELGYARGYLGIGLIYLQGIPGLFPQDAGRTFACFQRAVELDDTPYSKLAFGSLLIGEFYHMFSIMPPTDALFLPQEGERLLLEAAGQGESQAYAALSHYYYSDTEMGMPGKVVDYKRSEAYARMGAEKGNQRCLLRLARGYDPRQDGKYGKDRALSSCYHHLYYHAERGKALDLDALCPRPLTGKSP